LLIIFDLDDTLIQTSQFITPWRFEKVLENMKAIAPLRHQIMHDLMKSHLQYDSSSQALEEVLSFHKVDRSLIELAKAHMSSFDMTIPVHLFEGVSNMLETLKAQYALALVTKGRVDQQSLKIEKAGFKENFFDQVFIVDSGDKKDAFKQASKGFLSNKVLVVGDRVNADLKPAKDLGFHTCLVRQGRGEFQKISPMLVDYIIQDVTEVENLLKSIQ
jgi:FMN phosphatase YigB (HAD superfamily)